MPSTEHSTLTRIQQEIDDVIERERELKKLNGCNAHPNGSDGNNDDNNNNKHDEMEPSDGQKTTLMRIQEEIQHVLDRERELRASKPPRGHANGADIASNQNGPLKTNGEVSQPPAAAEAKPPVRAPLIRAKSTSVLEDATHLAAPAAPIKPHFRRAASNGAANPNKGVMHRFLKQRGRVQAITALTVSMPHRPTTNGFHPSDGYELAPPKVAPGQLLRRNYIPTEVRIQRDIETTYKRETELKTLRQSQGNLALLDECELDAPLEGCALGLRASKSMAQLYASDESLGGERPSASAPSSLKPAKSLAQLCDAKDEDVTSPQALITHFQQMIIQNQVSKRT